MEGGMTLATIISDMTTFITGLISWFTDLVGCSSTSPSLVLLLSSCAVGSLAVFNREEGPGNGAYFNL